MPAERQSYHSYLVRFWRPEAGNQATWYALLEDPHTGETHGFADLPALFRFLRALLEGDDGPPASGEADPANSARSTSHPIEGESS